MSGVVERWYGIIRGRERKKEETMAQRNTDEVYMADVDSCLTTIAAERATKVAHEKAYAGYQATREAIWAALGSKDDFVRACEAAKAAHAEVLAAAQNAHNTFQLAGRKFAQARVARIQAPATPNETEGEHDDH